MDGTLCETKVPATCKPGFAVSPDANFIPINGLSSVRDAPDKYLIIGAGKTGVDAVLYLLDNKVDPDKIMWIMPNDVWFFARSQVEEFSWLFTNMMGAFSDERNETWKDCYKM